MLYDGHIIWACSVSCDNIRLKIFKYHYGSFGPQKQQIQLFLSQQSDCIVLYIIGFLLYVFT